jgi:ribosome-associated protein
MSESYLVIELNQQPVELCKLLKIADLVSGGGEAKVVISEGYVLLNGEVEYQKRKKVYHEDVVEFNGEVVQLIINEALTQSFDEVEEQPEIPAQQVSSPSKNKAAQQKEKSKKKPANQPKMDSVIEPVQQNDAQVNTPKKRRPISF